MASDLKPCPVCGNNGQVICTYGINAEPLWWQCVCSKCDYMVEPWTNRKKAIEKWNGGIDDGK